MLRKFCSVIALIYFLLIGTMSASASEWCPIYDYSVNDLLDSIKKIETKENNSIYNIKSYTEKGTNYVTANFGDNNKNIIKFYINKNGSIQWVTITRPHQVTSTESFSKFARDKIEAGKEIYNILYGILKKIGMNNSERKELADKLDIELDKTFKNINDFKKIENISIYVNNYCKKSNRYYRIRCYFDKYKYYYSLQAYK